MEQTFPTKIESFTGNNKFLSNFYPCTIVWDGIIYPSLEHAYQASKTDDVIERKRIAGLRTAGETKRAGKKIKLKPSWDLIKVEIMRVLVHIKFQYPTLREMLLNTGEAELIEGNFWYDFFWGVCKGKGKNTLGMILMSERESIRNGVSDVVVC